MNLQVIKSVEGQDEYVLLPINLYHSLNIHSRGDEKLKIKSSEDYVVFDPADYIDNPIALARIKAGVTQKELAEALKVSQAYVSKLERQDAPSAKTLHKVKEALKTLL
ncbi:MAG TPA: helix-turn-helix transcriptional regulator [Coxiellaceae bacterium]|nr:helix-turn-helix transcriptional regulator [Coxiellaceae bacterium]